MVGTTLGKGNRKCHQISANGNYFEKKDMSNDGSESTKIILLHQSSKRDEDYSSFSKEEEDTKNGILGVRLDINNNVANDKSLNHYLKDYEPTQRPKPGKYERMYADKDVDQGWAWLVMVSSFFGCFITAGMCYSFGVYYTEYLKRFPDHKITISLLTGLPSALFLILGPVSVFCAKTIGYHWTVAIGCTIGTIGYTASYFVVPTANIYALCLTHGMLVGIGGGMLYSPIVCVLKLCFVRRYVLANAFGLTGVACGCLAYPFIYHLLIATFGLRGSLLVNAAQYMQIYLIAAVLARPSHCGTEVDEKGLDDGGEKGNPISREGCLIAKRKESLTTISRKSSLICILTAPPVTVPEIIETLAEVEEQHHQQFLRHQLSKSSCDSSNSNNSEEGPIIELLNSESSSNTTTSTFQNGPESHMDVRDVETGNHMIKENQDLQNMNGASIQNNQEGNETGDNVKIDDSYKYRHQAKRHAWKSDGRAKETSVECSPSITSSVPSSPATNGSGSTIMFDPSQSLIPMKSGGGGGGRGQTSSRTATIAPSIKRVFENTDLDSQQPRHIGVRSWRGVLFMLYAPCEQASCIIILIMISKFAQSLGIDTFRSSTLISWVGIGELCGCLSIVLWGIYYSSIAESMDEQPPKTSHSIGTINDAPIMITNNPPGKNVEGDCSQQQTDSYSLDNGSVHTGIFFITALVVQGCISGIFALDISQSYAYFCGLMLVFGYFYGVRITLLNSLIIDLFGSGHFTLIYSAYFFVAGIGCLLSLPLATWLSIVLKNPFAMFYITTTTFLACVILLSVTSFSIYRAKWRALRADNARRLDRCNRQMSYMNGQKSSIGGLKTSISTELV